MAGGMLVAHSLHNYEFNYNNHYSPIILLCMVWVTIEQFSILLHRGEDSTTTIPEHQSVGSWIFEITPRVSIRSSSFLTAPMSGTATRLGVDKANGLAPGSS